MRSRSDCVLVALKESELGAESTRVSIAVTAEVGVALVHGAILVDGRHGDKRHLTVARASHVDGVVVELDGASEQIRCEVAIGPAFLGRLVIKSYVADVARVHPDAAATTGSPLTLVGSAVSRAARDIDDLVAAIDSVAE